MKEEARIDELEKKPGGCVDFGNDGIGIGLQEGGDSHRNRISSLIGLCGRDGRL